MSYPAAESKWYSCQNKKFFKKIYIESLKQKRKTTKYRMKVRATEAATKADI